MKKLKFPEDFFAYKNPDCPDKDIEKAVNRMKNWMKGERPTRATLGSLWLLATI